MFEPVFVYESHATSETLLSRMREKGFRCVDIHQAGATVHGGNPAIVIYDRFAHRATFNRDKELGYRFTPPKKTAVMVFTTERKGYIYGLPEPTKAIEEITGCRCTSYSSITTNFKLSA